jgi:hypothetical protein
VIAKNAIAFLVKEIRGDPRISLSKEALWLLSQPKAILGFAWAVQVLIG